MKAIKKDYYTEIKKSFSRFVSILLIVALGVAFYAGIRSTEPDMRLTGDKLYDESNLLDLKVISTMGLSQSDVEAINNLENIEKAIGSYSADVIAQTGKNNSVLRFMSLLDGVNVVTMTDGNQPVNITECIVDETFMENEKLSIGDTITVKGAGQAEVTDLLKETEYKIVGTFTTTQYMSSSSKGTSSVGNGKIEGLVIVKEEAFAIDVFTEIYAVVKDAKELICYDDDYHNKIEEAKKMIEDTIMDGCILAKYDELYGSATEIIEGIESNITDTNQIIAKSKKTIKKLNSAITKAEKAKASVEEEIAKSQQKIEMFDAFIAQYSDLGYVPAGILNTYDVSIAQMEREKQQYIEAKEPYEQIVTESETIISQSKDGIIQAKAAITEAERILNDLELGLADANEARDALESPTWYLTDRTHIQTYVEYDLDAERISNIGIVFPVIFFLVATLVSLTTMTRMIAEQRTQIGTLKALGYSKFTIAFKYIKYALSATVTGSVIGIFIGSKLFPVVILNAYQLLYPSLHNVVTPINWEHAVTATVIAIVCVLVATIFASFKTLSSSASDLMRPESPKMGKKILLERIPFVWKHLNFNAKSTIRNLVRYKKRFFMTLFGVSGCMALIVVGFGLKDSTSEIVNMQYGQLHTYDAAIEFNLSSNIKRMEEVNDFLDNDERVSDYLRINESTVEVSSGSRKVSGTAIVPVDETKISDYIVLRENSSKEAISIPENEIVVSEKLAKLLNVKVGDAIQVSIGETDKREIKIGAITENYVFHYIYLSPQLYQQVFNKEPSYNKILLRTNPDKDVDTAAFTDELLNLKAINSVSFIQTLQDKFQDLLRSIDIIVMVLVVSAGALAFIVLYNLNNINITERKRELATLKVLGFYNKEVTGYIYRENIIITILGLVIGCGLGAVLHQFVIRTAEVDIIMFSRQIFPVSYLYSALITIVFSILINITMYFKLKKINMAESIKTID